MREYQLVRSRRKTVAPDRKRMAAWRCVRRGSFPEMDRRLCGSKGKLDSKENRRAGPKEANRRELTRRRKPPLKEAGQEYLPERALGAFPRDRIGSLPGQGLGAKTRWAPARGKNSVCLSWRLMEKPPEVIDYVIIHELCHTVHHDHSREFWALVASFCRTAKGWRRRLANE